MSADNNETAKRVFICECTRSVFVAGDIVCLEFLWPGPAPRGGQFFLIKPRRTGVFLGRPISVAGWEPREDRFSERNADKRLSSDRRKKIERHIKVDRRTSLDRRLSAGGILRFFVARRGQGSRELMDLRPGEEAELVGPLGNYWARSGILKDFSLEKSPGPIALVGGGIGIAPLLAFAAELSAGYGRPRHTGREAAPETKKIPFDFYAGFRTGSFGLENIKPRSLTIATEDGSLGLKGRIPDFFTPSGYRGVFICGPEIMLKVVGDACIASGVPCFVSMEKHMACGVGACLGCTVKTTGGNRRCCADGPVFNVEEICFENQ